MYSILIHHLRILFKGRIEYLVKWKHYDKSHNSWEPEGNILDKSLIDLYKKQTKLSSSSKRNSSSPKKPQQTSIETLNSTKNELEKTDDIEQEEKDKTINSTPIDYWYPPVSEQKTKIAITDITSDNVTITFREII